MSRVNRIFYNSTGAACAGLLFHSTYMYYYTSTIFDKSMFKTALAFGTLGGVLTTNYGRKLNPLSSESILRKGIDRRVKVAEDQVVEWPWRVHGQLQLSYKMPGGKKVEYIGSGTLIGDKYVLTAGHNLYDHDTGKAVDSITFFPGKHDSNIPWSSKAKSFTIHPLYKNARYLGEQKDHDIGVVELENPLGTQLGFFGVNVFDARLINKVRISGYPGNPDDGRYMYTMEGNIETATSSRIYYDIDTYGGQSGSSINFELEDLNICVGVHAYGTEDKRWWQWGMTSDNKYNSGTRITFDKLNDIKEWTK